MEELLDCIENSACYDDEISRKDVLWLIDIAREACRLRGPKRGAAIKKLNTMLEAGSNKHLEC